MCARSLNGRASKGVNLYGLSMVELPTVANRWVGRVWPPRHLREVVGGMARAMFALERQRGASSF